MTTSTRDFELDNLSNENANQVSTSLLNHL